MLFYQRLEEGKKKGRNGIDFRGVLKGKSEPNGKASGSRRDAFSLLLPKASSEEKKKTEVSSRRGDQHTQQTKESRGGGLISVQPHRLHRDRRRNKRITAAVVWAAVGKATKGEQ